MKTFVYRNLRTGNFSLRNSRTGLVYGHKHTVFLAEAEFKVGAKGRERVLREGRKNVHAGVLGTVVATSDGILDVNEVDLYAQGRYREVSYNPYLGDTFTYKDTGEPVEPVKGGYSVTLTGNKAFILLPMDTN